MGDADGGQYVTRLEGAAGTGGTGTRIDVLLVQEQQEGLTFDVLESDVYVIRETMRRITVQAGVRNLVKQTLYEVVANGAFLRDALRHAVEG